MLNNAQKQKAIDVWNDYNTNSILVESEEQLDQQRNNAIPYAQEVIKKFLNKNVMLEEFKIEIDGFNKKNSLWGFKGINGQMFFNMFFNTSSGAGMVDKLDDILKTSVPVPKDIAEAKHKVDLLTDFSNSLSSYVSDKRSAPRTGSALFFISYFWQIQNSW